MQQGKYCTACETDVYKRQTLHYEQEQEVSEQIRSAVTYPLIMLGMMGIVIVVLLVKVLPVFQQVFQQMGMEMNTLSLGLLKAGSILSNYSGIFLILVVLLVSLILFLSLSAVSYTHLDVYKRQP